MDRAEACEILNFYRNRHYTEPIGTEERELSDAINEILPHYATLREQEQKWISVEERLPEVLDLYLVVVKQKYSWEKTYRISTDCASYQPFGEDGYIDGCWDTCNDWDEGEDYIHITHWMPMPEPPKEGADG